MNPKLSAVIDTIKARKAARLATIRKKRKEVPESVKETSVEPAPEAVAPVAPAAEEPAAGKSKKKSRKKKAVEAEGDVA